MLPSEGRDVREEIVRNSDTPGTQVASGKPERIDEERRLLYVAMTRAREHLHLLQPSRFYLRTSTAMAALT